MATKKLGSLKATDVVLITSANLAADVTGVLPVANGGNGTGSFTDGQILIGNTTGNTLVKTTLTGTSNQVVVTNGAGAITLSLPQSIATTSSPTFGGVLYSGATSGVTTLQAPAVAGSAVVTLPAATGTLPTLEAANRFTAANNRFDGYLGIGGAADANAILNLGGANPLTGAVQVGTLCALVGTSAATTAIRGHQMACRTAAAAFTCADMWNYYTGANVAGAGSTITRSAKFVAYRDVAATNNLGYYYGSALTWVGNWCLYMDAAYDSYLGTGSVGIGTTTISAKVHAVSTTEQLRLGYDASNYLSTTVSSAGLATLATTGTNASITLTPSGTGNVIMSKIPRFNGTNSTGAGSSLLGANSPATTLTAPYTWISVITSDGSTAYIPCWK